MANLRRLRPDPLHLEMPGRSRRLVAASVVALGVLLLPPTVAHATAPVMRTRLLFVAPTGSDTANVCGIASSPCASIGHALTEAGPDAVIDLAAGTYHEHGLVVGTTVAIRGAGPAETVIDAGRKGQAILVERTGSLALTGTTIRNGDSRAHAGAVENSGVASFVSDRFVDDSAVDPGGAIVNYTTVTAMDDDRFVGDSTQSYGGAVTNFGSVLAASGDTFDDNDATDGAGAVENEGTITTLDDSSFRANSAGYAGAVDNSGLVGDLSSDTFWDNAVYGYGGALVNVFGTIGTVSDDTFEGNSVTDPLGEGGAIEQDEGTISTLADDTITGNSATIGGGIDNEGSSVVGGIAGVIFARNRATEGAACENFMSRLVEVGYNLEGDRGAGCGFRADRHDLVGIQPDLRRLGAYGGTTLTEPPWPASPVVDVGPTTTCPTTNDARGVPRPQGIIGACDIGAVELALPHPTLLSPSGGPAAGGTRVAVTGSGFTLTTAVSVGRTPVRFHVVSDGTLVFVTPPGRGSEPVRITDTDGPAPASLPYVYGAESVAPWRRTAHTAQRGSAPRPGGMQVLPVGVSHPSAASK